MVDSFLSNVQVAIIVSCFNSSVTDTLYANAKQRLIIRGMRESHIKIVQVPGAVEIPLMAQQLGKTKKYNAIVCVGAIIRGETDHYDYVCQQVSYGCQRVALDLEIPVIFGILTTQTASQAYTRVNGAHGDKGKDCADAAIDMMCQMAHL